jgi:choline dehydrogenase-like flavoprotein
MIIDDQHYDLIIIGTGAGGGTLAQKLAPTGRKILILERGGFTPPAVADLSDVDVFKRERYHSSELWYDNTGEPFSPQANHGVGGNTKIYSSALLRMRERDFEAVKHQDGISPAWELKYSDFEPYYTAAEQLYGVHGTWGNDPTEPHHSSDFPYPAVSHEAEMEQVVNAIAKQGLHPTVLPLGLLDRSIISDAESCGITPALKYPNVTLKTSAQVVYLHTNSSGRTVKAVEAKIDGQSQLFFGDIIVLACGAIESAALLLRSSNDQHPTGLANSSDLVGRNLMKHLLTVVVQLSTAPNSGKFAKTVSVNDFYWGDPDFPYPLGHIQNTGGLLRDVIFAESPPILSILARLMPSFGLRQLATHSIGWWIQTESLPNPNNRVRIANQKLHLDYIPNNTEAHDRLIHRWTEVLKTAEKSIGASFQSSNLHPRGEMPIQVVANQCGTCKFGSNPQTSVLNLDCRTHDVDNLYVVDGSFFPSSAGVSPALTIMANALRVGDILIKRLKGGTTSVM